jgi:hypothetical protein
MRMAEPRKGLEGATETNAPAGLSMIESLEQSLETLVTASRGDPLAFAQTARQLDDLISCNMAKCDEFLEGVGRHVGDHQDSLKLTTAAWLSVELLLQRYSRVAWQRLGRPMNAAYGPAALSLLRDGQVEAARFLAAQALRCDPAAALNADLLNLVPDAIGPRCLKSWKQSGPGAYQSLLLPGEGNELWVLEESTGTIHLYDRQGAYQGRLNADLPAATAMFEDAEGFIWLCCPGEGRIVRVDKQGQIEIAFKLAYLRVRHCEVLPLGGCANKEHVHLKVLVGGRQTQVLTFDTYAPAKSCFLWYDNVVGLCAHGGQFTCLGGDSGELSNYRQIGLAKSWRLWRRRFLPEGFAAATVQAFADRVLVGNRDNLLLLDEGLWPTAWYSRRSAAGKEPALPPFDRFCADPVAQSVITYDWQTAMFHEIALGPLVAGPGESSPCDGDPAGRP